MDLRPPTAPEPGATDGTPGPRTGAAGEAQWRVSPRLALLKAAGAVVLALVAVLSLGDPIRLAVAGFGAALLAALAGRDLVAPVRVAADAAGLLLVTGYANRRRVPWSRIERIRVDERTRFGLRTELLEIDAGEDIYLYSAYELGAPCHEVADRLRALVPRPAPDS